ncbi:30S ribosomal protein S12 methylthiotransferase RimO [Clostridium botulinum]|uniref:Ribosomal protein uS12 methylthiotransferase RimO n=1 Tax=Clostridium botulinum C/D str. DC5 TaxID=1443128 RepID=A0A0A0IEZ1_CLOBO|nr:30S ribosomal protein S12 methylthiotransferase RimO [Clostridium botulinum]KGM94206.1 ribosomal protein S12 methylthiotransferase [Clostridium botulinum D str. CCUG 7971]KGM99093.1 ribosomal protein S12 methylthiotransferase [Clostridium botulinum C/D str. DC5]KOC45883.1 ribosomal protein S12 methylthiotransferase [Clostridium botulinum]KOC54443.1 ribosomal protein S12 methylthiotransferase [Clostridium botulinum]KOC58452.1 ribosomal protein S12 methylthiotransferase [Clostridium botulinum
MNRYKIGLISLGCDKNRIDSELLLGKLNEKNEIVNNPNEAHIIIVNTCGFIETSKQESIDTIIEMAQYKDKNCKMIIATGCLTQRYSKELQELIPEIDIMLGVNDYANIQNHIDEFFENHNKICQCKYSDVSINEGKRILTTDKHVAYIRISEGCDNFCTYCIIPKIRGKYRSRSIDSIVKEAKELAAMGVKELILVGQDTAIYGRDIYNENKLPELIRAISEIEAIEWIRVLYTYPEEITDELIEEIKNNDKVCNYLDIPIQHVSNTVLKRMNRRSTKEIISENIRKMRSEIKDLCLRTSIIVGFPGETEDEFNELKEFIKEIKFDNLGVFKYSQEEDTAAARMKDQLSEEVKESRLEELMIIQQQVSKEKNKNKIGKVYKVLIEGHNDEYWIGRNYQMTPEIDGAIFFKCDKILNVGEFIYIKITDALEYDLIGVVCDESGQ